jgi:putative SOS response-associated peptidase YedK
MTELYRPPSPLLAHRLGTSHIPLMCGRYASYLLPEFIARLFGTVNPLPNLQPTWNMAPTMDAPVVRRRPENGERHLDVLKWGLVPSFTKDLKTARKPINARSETVPTSRMFKAAFARRRCLVPAAAYYEWRDDPEDKVPFAVARVDGDPVVFAGIWEEWRSPEGNALHTFSTITTDANRQLSAIQPRMPVIVERGDWPVWLGEAEGEVAALLRPAPEDVLRLWSIDKRVGNVRNDGPELLEPRLQAGETLALL